MTRVEKVQRLLDEATVAVRSLEDAAATEEIAVG
jgi:hypothetical protein